MTTPGRPRDRNLDAAILSATLELLAERGYLELSLEEVAHRAGTSRPAIYRRWPGRAPLALAAIADRLATPPPPDTGCTLCDLSEGIEVFLAAYRTIRPDVLSSVFADCSADPLLRDRYIEAIVEPPRRAVAQTLDRAIARGDIRPDADRDGLLDMLASIVHYRAVFQARHLTEDDASAVVETLLRGAAVDYPALVEHSATHH
ncbi:TetR/AcrR family transcriptional regulator [Hoyosella sp. G463]|uniref:TetR/AcrR family transcriptional regulator n=1 Tax=Lolliginicoccus lacisalsi TaxID=2742202 RepID=A0A927J9V8_9ACTN|nr:TetR/AcrR family transcriptional regulator [Lolliginicoccus lacisalsi]MBD8505005.1 TetR/AcrR family transcriptional regulator [Lolliginicoccus lacisalsi]